MNKNINPSKKNTNKHMRTADYQKPNLRYNLKYSQRVCQKNKEKRGVELLWAEPDADRFSSPEPSLVSIIALGKRFPFPRIRK